MNTLELCSNREQELYLWRERLAHLTGRIDALPSIEKYKLTTHIEGLHMLLTEMDDRIEQLRVACPVNGPEETDEYASGEDFSPRFKENTGVGYDYDFGG